MFKVSSNQNRLMKTAESQNILSAWHHRFTRQAWPLSECLETYLACRLLKTITMQVTRETNKRVGGWHAEPLSANAQNNGRTSHLLARKFTGPQKCVTQQPGQHSAADSSLEPWKAGSFCGRILSLILPSRLSGDSVLSNSSARAQIRYFRTQAGPSIQALTRVGNDKR